MKKIVIVGGGSAGITVAARIIKAARKNEVEVTIIEPSRVHYYQPLWTLVGAGIFPREKSKKLTTDVIPTGVDWIQRRVTAIDPDRQFVSTDDHQEIAYDFLIVCPGIKVDWGGIPGLKQAVGHGGVCSNYDYDTVESTFQALKEFRGGRAIFTFPKSAVKCAGAPQKIMYLAEEYFRRSGVRENTEILYIAPGASIFGVEYYRPPLESVVKRKGIDTLYGHHVTALDGQAKEVEVTRVEDGQTTTMKFDFIHVTPPQSAPEVVSQSSLADTAGWAEVDKHTTQSPRYPNVFSLGDASSLPTSKTAAAIRKEAPVLVQNLFTEMRGHGTQARYNGYSSCPLVTGYNKTLIAEFDYDGRPTPTLPLLDPRKERYINYLLKAYGIPFLYWHLMLKGLL